MQFFFIYSVVSFQVAEPGGNGTKSAVGSTIRGMLPQEKFTGLDPKKAQKCNFGNLAFPAFHFHISLSMLL